MEYPFVDGLKGTALELSRLVVDICPPKGLSPYLLMGICFAESNYGKALVNGSGDFIPRAKTPARDSRMKKIPLPGVVCKTLANGIPARKINGPVEAWCPTSTGWAVGVFQFDWESHWRFSATGKWNNLSDCLAYAVGELLAARKYLAQACVVSGDELDEAMIASYNAGAGAVAKAIKSEKPVDSVTFHRGYVEKIKQEADRLASQCGAWRSLPQREKPINA